MEWNGMEWNGMEWNGREGKGREGKGIWFFPFDATLPAAARYSLAATVLLFVLQLLPVRKLCRPDLLSSGVYSLGGTWAATRGLVVLSIVFRR